jgi:hypothetical protein
MAPKSSSSLTKREVVELLLIGYLPALLLLAFGRLRLPPAIVDFYVAHPLELIFVTYSLPMLGMLYLRPQSPLRLAILPLVAFGVYCYRSTCLLFMPNRTQASGAEGPFYLLYLNSVDALVLRRLYRGVDGKEKSEVALRNEKIQGKKDTNSTTQDSFGVTSWAAWGWAFNVVFSYRGIGSPRQAPNIPKFSSKDENYVPSRLSFLLKRGVAIVVAFLLVDILNHQPKPDPETFSNSMALLIPSMVNAETVGTRIFSTFLFWFILRITIGLIYNLVSFIGVATFLSKPADWPPYFGSPSDTYTLRKFWSYVNHCPGMLKNHKLTEMTVSSGIPA